jgi:elongation factor Ts
VHRYPAARIEPLRFLTRIAEYYAYAVGADPGYAGVLAHNPASTYVSPYETTWGREDPYSLEQLASVIPFGWEAPAIRQTGVGRNVDLFEAGMRWAGRRANEGTVASYIHHGGRIGVLVELNCETDFVAKSDQFQKMARDLAMHVAAAQPRWVRIEDVPEEVVGNEKELIAREARASGKPERVVEMIVTGKLRSYFKDHVLYEQEFIRTDQYEGKVGDMVTELAAAMGENIGVRRFSRIAVGEREL